MRLKKPNVLFLTLALFAIPLLAHADSWKCEYASQVREVDINRTSTNSVPCQVVYRKPTEGMEDQVVWTADHEVNYCEEKARGLIARLESYGWLCVETMHGENASSSAGDNTEGEGTEDSSTGEDSDKGGNAAGS